MYFQQQFFAQPQWNYRELQRYESDLVYVHSPPSPPLPPPQAVEERLRIHCKLRDVKIMTMRRFQRIQRFFVIRQQIMKRAWGIADAAVAAFGGTKHEYFITGLCLKMAYAGASFDNDLEDCRRWMITRLKDLKEDALYSLISEKNALNRNDS